MEVKLPRLNQLIMLTISVLIILAVVRLLPENVKKWFRV